MVIYEMMTEYLAQQRLAITAEFIRNPLMPPAEAEPFRIDTAGEPTKSVADSSKNEPPPKKAKNEDNSRAPTGTSEASNRTKSSLIAAVQGQHPLPDKSSRGMNPGKCSAFSAIPPKAIPKTIPAHGDARLRLFKAVPKEPDFPPPPPGKF